MKKYLIILLSVMVLSSCAESQKEFSTVNKGMTKEEVVKLVGEPTSKKDILIAEIWKYDPADRTIVFRNGTVYEIITSTEARIDSIESTLKTTGRDLKEKFKQTSDTLDSTGRRLKNKIAGDSVKRY